jgi:branched-chain amino acid transport system substrate-binding protein
MSHHLKKVVLSAAIAAISAPLFAAAPSSPVSEAKACVFVDTINFGRTAALTGINQRKGNGTDRAIRAVFDRENALHCGVNGHKLALLTEDDGYSPARAKVAAQKLLDKNVFAFLAPNGTGPTKAIYPMVTGAKVPLVGTTSGNIDEKSRYFFNTRNSNFDDSKGITQFLSAIGDPSITVVYEKDAFGQGAMKEMEKAAKEDKVEITARIEMPADTKEAGKFLEELMKSGGSKAHSIALLLIDTPTANMVKAIRAQGYLQRVFAITSSGEFELELGKDLSNGVIVSQSHPALNDPSYVGTNDFTQLMKKSDKDFVNSTAAFEGYLSARIAIEGLKGAGKLPTRESFIDALEKFHMREIGGFYYSYDTPEHVGSRYNELFMWGPNGEMIY